MNNSGADSIVHGARAPHFYKWLMGTGPGGTASRRTTNEKLTKLSSRKRSPKRLIVLVKPKKWRGTTNKKMSSVSLQIRSDAIDE